MTLDIDAGMASYEGAAGAGADWGAGREAAIAAAMDGAADILRVEWSVLEKAQRAGGRESVAAVAGDVRKVLGAFAVIRLNAKQKLSSDAQVKKLKSRSPSQNMTKSTV